MTSLPFVTSWDYFRFTASFMPFMFAFTSTAIVITLVMDSFMVIADSIAMFNRNFAYLPVISFHS